MEKYLIIKLDTEVEYDLTLINKVESKSFHNIHEIPSMTIDEFTNTLTEIMIDKMRERKQAKK